MTDTTPERYITIETIGRRLFGLGRMDGAALDVTTKRANAESLLLIAAALERIADALEPDVYGDDLVDLTGEREAVTLDLTVDETTGAGAVWQPILKRDAEDVPYVAAYIRTPDVGDFLDRRLTIPVVDGDDDLGTPVEPDPLPVHDEPAAGAMQPERVGTKDPFADKKKAAKS
jgi:hypothetical protein